MVQYSNDPYGPNSSLKYSFSTYMWHNKKIQPLQRGMTVFLRADGVIPLHRYSPLLKE